MTISCSTAPNAQMSARRSTSRPRACSGAMWETVESIREGDMLAAALRDVDSSKYSGTIALFQQHLVKTGFVD